MRFDEFVIVRFSNVDSQFLANIPDPKFDLALTIDKLNPLNENDFSMKWFILLVKLSCYKE